MSDNTVWIVGQVFPVENEPEKIHDHWEFQGVFTSKKKALEACNEYKTDFVFIGRIELDTPLPLEVCDWPHSWFPKLETEPDQND